MILLFLLVIAPICGTVITVTILAVHTSRPPRLVREAEAKRRAAELKTAQDIEEWKQDWMLNQRHNNEPPQLPPGTQTVLPRYPN